MKQHGKAFSSEGVTVAIAKKIRKKVEKTVAKLIRKHGPEVVTVLAASIGSALAALARTKAPGRKGKKSNLKQMAEDVRRRLTRGSKPLRKATAQAKAKPKPKPKPKPKQERSRQSSEGRTRSRHQGTNAESTQGPRRAATTSPSPREESS